MQVKMEQAGTPSPDEAHRDPIRSKVMASLTEAGYEPGSMGQDEWFVLAKEGSELRVPIEILVYVNRQPAILVKCTRGHLSTRERASLSLARLLCDRPVPFAIVANETDAVVYDAMTGKPVGHGYAAFPSPAAAEQRLRECVAYVMPPAKRKQEERILSAFYHLRCNATLEPF